MEGKVKLIPRKDLIELWLESSLPWRWFKSYLVHILIILLYLFVFRVKALLVDLINLLDLKLHGWWTPLLRTLGIIRGLVIIFFIASKISLMKQLLGIKMFLEIFSPKKGGFSLVWEVSKNHKIPIILTIYKCFKKNLLMNTIIFYANRDPVVSEISSKMDHIGGERH